MTVNDLIVFAQTYGWDDDHHDGGWIVMGFGMLLFWVLVIVLVVWLVRTWGPGHHSAPHGAPSESPLEVLDRRLAEGALSVDEYEKRKQILGGG